MVAVFEARSFGKRNPGRKRRPIRLKPSVFLRWKEGPGWPHAADGAATGSKELSLRGAGLRDGISGHWVPGVKAMKLRITIIAAVVAVVLAVVCVPWIIGTREKAVFRNTSKADEAPQQEIKPAPAPAKAATQSQSESTSQSDRARTSRAGKKRKKVVTISEVTEADDNGSSFADLLKASESSGGSGGGGLNLAGSGGGACPPNAACDSGLADLGKAMTAQERQKEMAQHEREAARQAEQERQRDLAALASEERARQQDAGAQATPPPPSPTQNDSAKAPGESSQIVVEHHRGKKIYRIQEPLAVEGKEPPAGSSPPGGTSISDLGKEPPVEYKKKTTYDFDEDVVEGDLARPDGNALQQQAPSPIERYPNIEAPDTVAIGQEIAVQVSLTSDQLAPETKILSGAQHEGKLQLQDGGGREPVDPHRESDCAGNGVYAQRQHRKYHDYARWRFDARGLLSSSSAGALAAEARRDTRILATLLHDGAFLARLSRPLAIVASTAQPPASEAAASVRMARPVAMKAAEAAAPAAKSSPAIEFDPDIAAPDLTIVENRVGSTLRVLFFSPYSSPVEADIADPDALHAWIEAHYAQMAHGGRGFAVEGSEEQASSQHAADYISGFGSELYDRFAPQAFKDFSGS